ncbi:hypothetical protein C8F04DRAFT_1196514 [Mycena alexandri]|uniref:Uncharacterized protein n=1 Tax=Mycena alexandri TaxID=1745969 RepID=A0AAD6S4R4_9AGAR|nr:hypothetical protein C8F04DRAFT_1196514 [Mycena alexandri]
MSNLTVHSSCWFLFPLFVFLPGAPGMHQTCPPVPTPPVYIKYVPPCPHTTTMVTHVPPVPPPPTLSVAKEPPCLERPASPSTLREPQPSAPPVKLRPAPSPFGSSPGKLIDLNLVRPRPPSGSTARTDTPLTPTLRSRKPQRATPKSLTAIDAEDSPDKDESDDEPPYTGHRITGIDRWWEYLDAEGPLRNVTGHPDYVPQSGQQPQKSIVGGVGAKEAKEHVVEQQLFLEGKRVEDGSMSSFAALLTGPWWPEAFWEAFEESLEGFKAALPRLKFLSANSLSIILAVLARFLGGLLLNNAWGLSESVSTSALHWPVE